MPIQTDNWTYAEFHAFVMLYAACADGRITMEEENLIMPTLTAEAYSRIKSIFMACDDAKALNIILGYRDKYYSTQADKDKILDDMKEIYTADAHFARIEQEMHHLFKRLL